MLMWPYTTVIASYEITHQKLCFEGNPATYQRHPLIFEALEKPFHWLIDAPM